MQLRTLSSRQLVFDIAVPTGLALVLLPWYYARDPLWTVVLIAMCAALAFWRLQPGIALGIAWAGALFQVLTVVSPDPSNLAIPIVLYATSAYGTRRVRWFGFASAFLGAAAVTITLLGSTYIGSLIVDQLFSGSLETSALLGVIGQAALIFVGSLAGFLLSWTLGLVGSAIMRASESRRAVVLAVEEVAAEQERTRIARDMHDVVAHSLAVVVAQADGARYLRKTDPDAVDDALQTIATTAREALSDVRVLLAQLRHSQSDGPQPTLVDLDRLYEQLRSSGLSIVQEVAGTPLQMGTSGQLAVYRIVQESLTNALRHADVDDDVLVRFTWTPYGLDLTVASTVRPVSTRTAENTLGQPPGHGIAGMRERATLVGGRLTAERDGERFVVHAWLPAGQPTQPIAIVTPAAASASATSILGKTS